MWRGLAQGNEMAFLGDVPSRLMQQERDEYEKA